MSLTTDQLLKPREIIEDYNNVFENTLQNLDEETLFKKVEGLEVQKRLLKDAIFSQKPVNIGLIGPAGNGKTLLLECIQEAFPFISLLVHSHTSSGVGVIESIITMGKKLRFLLVDEIERFSKRDRQAFLSLMEGGKISRRLVDRDIYIEGFRVHFIFTSNNIDKMIREEKPFMNRCEIIRIPALEYKTFLHVASRRLQKEKGVHNEDIAKYIASRTFHEFGNVCDMRRAVRLAQMVYSRSIRTQEDDTIDKDMVDAVVSDLKQVHFML